MFKTTWNYIQITFWALVLVALLATVYLPISVAVVLAMTSSRMEARFEREAAHLARTTKWYALYAKPGSFVINKIEALLD